MERERHEPTFSKPDLQDLQFRSERRQLSQHRPPSNGSGLIWKVALGVFIGVSACALATCTALGTLGYAVQKQREVQMNKTIEDLNKIANDPDPMGFRKIVAERQREEAQRAMQDRPPPLGPNERCIGATRLRRIENGWVQAGSCP